MTGFIRGTEDTDVPWIRSPDQGLRQERLYPQILLKNLISSRSDSATKSPEEP
jgi:hypothetical protein